MQTSVEAHVACEQVFALAESRLDAALHDKTSAATEQAKAASALPPAIVFDVDETVLDNSPYQARMVQRDRDWDEDAWKAWVKEANADAVPGALRFVNRARRRGISVFFITNRGKDEETATRLNLKKQGFPVYPTFDNVLMSGEKPDWTSDKTSRRRFVAQKYRIVMLVGDDFNDFVGGTKTTIDARMSLKEKHNAKWGTRWFVVPNPQYGSWEKSLSDFDYEMADAEKLKRKYEALETKR
jgi:acid phosphatase